MPNRPPKKKKRDALREKSEQISHGIQQVLVGTWAEPHLREAYPDMIEDEFTEIVDRAFADGWRIEAENRNEQQDMTGEDGATAKVSIAVRHFMLLDPKGVVVSGLKLTPSDIEAYMSKMQAKIVADNAIAATIDGSDEPEKEDASDS